MQEQVREQCEAILVANERLRQAIMTDPVYGGTWREIQNLLTAAANVSKLLWGERQKYAKERESLRLSIGVTDSSVLQDTEMRNHFEHIDKRLHIWREDSLHHSHVDRIIGARDAVEGIDERDLFRRFDPTTGEVYFWGDTFDSAAIVREVRRIMPALIQETGKPFP